MKRPVRRGFVVLLPYVLAAAIAYGMVASALAVPLAYRVVASGAMSEVDCQADAGVDHVVHASVPVVSRAEVAPGRVGRTRDRDAHADHAGPATAGPTAAGPATAGPATAAPATSAPATAETATSAPMESSPTDGNRRPSPDHFECCTTRLGTVGTPALAVALVRRLEAQPRRIRTPRPRMPSRPRPWRVSLGRQPPAAAIGTMLGA